MQIRDTRRTRWTLAIVGAVSALVLWHLLTETLGIVSENHFPPPGGVVSEFLRTREIVLDNVRPTVTAGFVGFGLAVALAVVGAIVLTLDERVENALMPLIVGGNSVPRVTLAPLIIFYLGSGVASNYMIAAWVAFFPMFLNAMDSFGTVDEDYRHLFAVYDATRWQEYRHVRFPNALPQLFDGMKMAIILAMIGAVVGEFIATTRGLGYLSTFALRNANIALGLAVVAILGLISTAAIFLLYQVQDRVVFWEDSSFFTTEM